MCPSFRATLDERDSTRGRANALRIALSDPASGGRESGSGSSHPAPLGAGSPLAQRWVADVMDLCLSCKACKSECPANVDVAKLKAEFLQAFYTNRPRPLGHLLVKNIHRLSPLAALFAGLNNWLARRPFLRRIMESIAGIDRRRSLPELHGQHFRNWFSRRARSGAGLGVSLVRSQNSGLLTPTARQDRPPRRLFHDLPGAANRARRGHTPGTRLASRSNSRWHLCCGRADDPRRASSPTLANWLTKASRSSIASPRLVCRSWAWSRVAFSQAIPTSGPDTGAWPGREAGGRGRRDG